MSHLLALGVGAVSVALYLTAFFLPGLYRKNDFVWSGIGVFYALVLWFCAPRLTGAVLLGQMASVALLAWLGWQTLEVRWQTLPDDQQALLAKDSRIRQQLDSVKGFLNQTGTQAQTIVSKAKEPAQKPTQQPTQQPTQGDRPMVSDAPAVSEALGGAVGGVMSQAGGLFNKVKGSLQGRKTHGKKFVRPDSDDVPSTATAIGTAVTGAAVTGAAVTGAVVTGATAATASAPPETTDEEEWDALEEALTPDQPDTPEPEASPTAEEQAEAVAAEAIAAEVIAAEVIDSEVMASEVMASEEAIAETGVADPVGSDGEVDEFGEET